MKTILITGTSSGFGKAFCESLLQRGHQVIAAQRGDEARFEATFCHLPSDQRSRLHFIPLDVTNPADRKKALAFLEQKTGGGLDVLINNAGFGLMGPMELMTEAEIRYQMEVNFFGAVFLTQTLLPALRLKKGKVITISSIAGHLTFPFYGMYCASKYALEAAMEGFHYDLSPQGIQVCLVEPGGYKTDFASRSLQLAGTSASENSPYRARIEAFEVMKEKLMSRKPGPAAVARKVADLCEAERIPLRTLMGSDAHALSWIKKMTPDFMRVWITEKAVQGLQKKLIP